MQIRLSGANIVVLAENHNPAIASVEWLRSKDVFDENAVNFTHTPVLSFFESQNFQLVVEPNLLQIALKAPSETNVPRLERAACNYAKALPETPYRAVGLNYIWTVRTETQEDVSKVLKELFLADAEKVRESLGVEEYQAGGILVFREEPFRVRLVIEKSALSEADILCNFNYHANVRNFQETQEAIVAFQRKSEDSKRIVSRLFKSV